MHKILLSRYFREELQQRIWGWDLSQEGPIGSCLVKLGAWCLAHSTCSIVVSYCYYSTEGNHLGCKEGTLLLGTVILIPRGSSL